MEETKVAIRAAKEAGKLLMENFDKVHTIKVKNQQEIVTETDLESEKIILGILKKEFPGYSILAEESGMTASPRIQSEAGRGEGESEYLWVVDPLDGTTNYSLKIPFFNVTIALAERSGNSWEVVSGVVHAPFTKEMFFAEKGEGSFLNGERISVSKETDLKKLFISHCNGKEEHQMRRVLKAFQELRPVTRDFMRMKSAALELAYVANGRLGGFVLLGGKSWDVAAGSLLVKEAGGKATDFAGREWTLNAGDLLAANGQVHEQILERMKNI